METPRIAQIEIVPDNGNDTSYRNDDAWQRECRDIFMALRQQASATDGKLSILPESKPVEQGIKDIDFIFSSLAIAFGAILPFTPYIIEVLKTMLQFKQAKKIVLEETIKQDKQEYIRKIEINGPIDDTALKTMEDFFNKSVTDRVNITFRSTRKRKK